MVKHTQEKHVPPRKGPFQKEIVIFQPLMFLDMLVFMGRSYQILRSISLGLVEVTFYFLYVMGFITIKPSFGRRCVGTCSKHPTSKSKYSSSIVATITTIFAKDSCPFSGTFISSKHGKLGGVCFYQNVTDFLELPLH